jgi:dTDP-4-amino-4,6-dideoxygalactose transaminase
MDPSLPAVPLTRPTTDHRELDAVSEVLASGWLAGQGPRGAELERAFAELSGRSHAVAVNNCTAGLHLALAALGVGPGDEVLVADYTFPATGHAVLYCGGTPRFVDVRPDTGTIDVESLARRITSRTRGIIGVDALGVPADWTALEGLATDHGLFLLEDAACSVGGTFEGRACGAFGDVAVFSLHARKGITSGEGGVVVTDDAVLAERVRSQSCFGMRSAYARQDSRRVEIPEFDAVGYNYKLSDVLAAIALVQLDKLDGFLARRRELADRYAALLSDVPRAAAPQPPSDREPTWQTYAVTVDDDVDRDAAVLELRARGIGSNIGTYALHREPVYDAPADCPTSDQLFRRHLALPMYADLTDADQDRVVAALREVLTAGT